MIGLADVYGFEWCILLTPANEYIEIKAVQN